jgi:hypothetical protein
MRTSRACGDHAPARRARRNYRRGDTGSISVFVVFFAITALVLASMLVDLGNAINAQERAGDIAEQAARAAADDIDPASLRAGTVVIDTTTACQDAADIIARYDALSGVQAQIAQPNGCQPEPDQVTVTVEVTTTPVISTFFGSFTMHATESACPEVGVTEAVNC